MALPRPVRPFSAATSEADRLQLYETLDHLKRSGKLQYEQLSVEVPGTRKPGQTGHYRNVFWPDADVLLQAQKPQTLFELVQQVTDEIPDDNALGFLPRVSPASALPAVYAETFEWLSYAEVSAAKLEVGSALLHLFRSGALGPQADVERIDPLAGPDQGWGVGIWSPNRPEWQITDMATHAFGLVSVAMYDSLGADMTVYVANHSGFPVILTTLAHLASLLAALPSCPKVKVVVSADPLDGAEGQLARAWGASAGVRVLDFKELHRIGRENLIEPMPPRPENTATLCYTSGTTGNPKGAALTHRNMTTAVIAQAYGTNMPRRGIIECSYLPLAHIYGRFLDLVTIYLRGCSAYTTGDPARLMSDVALMRPHFFPSVPRVLNRIYATVTAQANAGGIQGSLLKKALAGKIQTFRDTGEFTHGLYDRLAFSSVRTLLGDRLIYHTTASAPAAVDVLETLKVAFGTESSETWGMSETVGTGSATLPGDPGATGTIGAPRLVNQFKLVDVPEMGYLSTDDPVPRGELLVRGRNVFSAYFKDEKNTREAFDDEGWFRTGDICSVDHAGRFKVIDRKKALIKLAQGKWVAVAQVDNVLGTSPLFVTFLAHGNPLKEHLVGVGVVDVPQLLAFVRAQCAAEYPAVQTEADVVALVDSGPKARALRQAVVEHLVALGRLKGLKGYELVKGVFLTTEPVSSDILTPSFKVKRQALKETYHAQLEQAYRESDEAPVGVKARL